MNASDLCIDCRRRRRIKPTLGDLIEQRCGACSRLDAAETLVRQCAPKCMTEGCDELSTKIVPSTSHHCDLHAPVGAEELPTAEYVRRWHQLGGVGSWSKLGVKRRS